MDDLHFVNNNSTLYPLILVMIILLFYNAIEKETFITRQYWYILDHHTNGK